MKSPSTAEKPPQQSAKKPRCHIEINTAALSQNLARVRELVPGAQVMAVLKADAYGHGIELVAKQLRHADEIAVTFRAEAERLLNHGIDKPLTLLSAKFDTADLEWFATNAIRPVVYDYEQLAQLAALSTNHELDIWLKLDTGMGRLGFPVDELSIVYEHVKQMDGVRDVSLMTHLAQADKPLASSNSNQFDNFAKALEYADTNQQSYRQKSLLNSAGIVAFPEQAADLVRPGIMLYGISPQSGLSADHLGLKPVMTFKSQVISVRRMPSGSTIGYGCTYTMDTDSRIAHIACGYGDGYPRSAPSGTNVWVNGFLVPLVGRVSMDMLAVDIGDLPVQVGDSVVLWGEENPIEDVAEAAGTIAYELTCSITQRVTRLTI